MTAPNLPPAGVLEHGLVRRPVLGRACLLLVDLDDLEPADAGELVEKAKRLQEDAARRLELRRNGQRRALADHTIARSVEHISRKLGITT